MYTFKSNNRIESDFMTNNNLKEDPEIFLSERIYKMYERLFGSPQILAEQVIIGET